MGLREKTVSGLGWTFLQQFSVQLISLGITIILARILQPAEFGLIAMLTVFISIGNSLLESGLTSSLIRSPDAGPADYATVFYFNLAGSILLYGLVYLAAPLVASFYQQPVLSAVLRVYALSFIVNAFFSVQNARLTREMNFRLQMLIQIPSVLAGGLLGLLLAVRGYGVWSLVWMTLATSFFSTVMHWICSGWRPHLVFSRRSFSRHFHFGYKMTLTGLLEILYKNIYVLIIGRYYPAAELGFYARADSLSQLPVANISAILSKVTYPMFASIHDDNSKLKMVYKRLMQQVMFWNAPVLILLATVAKALLVVLLTVKWLPAVPYFQLLCLSGIMYPLHAYNLNILKVKGRSDLILKLELIKKGCCVAGIFCVIPFGIYGLLYFQLFFNFAGYYINSIYSGKLISYPIREQVADVAPVIVVAVFAGIVVYLADRLYLNGLPLPPYLSVIVNGLLYFFIYSLLSMALKLAPVSDFKQIILKR